MLDRQNLAPVAQRALCEQTDLRQAVEHDPVGLHAIHGLEDLPRGFAELEVCRVKEALPFLVGQRAVGRRELVNDDRVGQCPAVRSDGLAQFLLGLRERDIEAALAAPGAFQQELNRDCGLAGSRLALEEEHVTTRESALQYIIQTADAGQGLHVGTRVGHCDHLG